MAIDYGYFRHRLDASDDPKLQSLVDDMGVVALGYYYSLLEIYGRKYSQMNDDEKVIIHRRTVSNVWRKRVDSCDKVLTKLQLSGLLVYTKCENTYSLDIPNFPKYFGSYKKKKEERTLIKGKEKKVKEKKVNKGKLLFDFENIYQEYPCKEGKKRGMENLHREIKTQEQYDNFCKALKNYTKKVDGSEKKRSSIMDNSMSKKHCEIINAIRALSDFYGRIDEKRVKAYASKIPDVDLSALNLACSHAINEMRMFPSLAELKGLISLHTRRKQDSDEIHNQKFGAEEKRLKKIKEQFNETIGSEHLKKFVKSWYINVYGRQNYDTIKQSGFDFTLFEKCALFDLADGQLNSQRAYDIGKRKANRG
jgi:hypothetical protein